MYCVMIICLVVFIDFFKVFVKSFELYDVDINCLNFINLYCNVMNYNKKFKIGVY